MSHCHKLNHPTQFPFSSRCSSLYLYCSLLLCSSHSSIPSSALLATAFFVRLLHSSIHPFIASLHPSIHSSIHTLILTHSVIHSCNHSCIHHSFILPFFLPSLPFFLPSFLPLPLLVHSIFLCIPGSATMCYVCDTLYDKCPEDSIAFTPALQCSKGLAHCLTRRVSDGRKSRFLRKCTDSCEDEVLTWQKGDNTLCQTCCSTDMCNTGGCSSAVGARHPSILTPFICVAMTMLALASFPYA